MKVYTSRYDYPGPGRLDITVKGNDPVGRVFAPTWAMVQAFKDATKATPKKNTWEEHQERVRLAWEEYKDMYHRMMFKSYGENRAIWESVLNRQEIVVLVCFCPDYTKCHRSLLASIFAWMGHDWAGELTREK